MRRGGSVILVIWLNAWGPAVSTGQPASQETRGLIERALDEPTTITLDNMKLTDAIKEVTRQAGVKIVMPPEVLELVPYGPETVVQKVDIAGMPLRRGLARLFSPLGMTFVVLDDHIRVVPKEALLCLGRRATWAELDTLAGLSADQPGVDQEALTRLQGMVQFQVAAPDPWAMFSQELRRIGAGPGDEVLTIACGKLAWSWCVSDERIVIGSIEQEIRRRLLRPISLRINYRPLFEVLTAVGRAVNVPIRQEPGTFASLPLHVRKNYSLNVHNESAELILDEIAADVGLGYVIEPDGVMFYRPEGGDQAKLVNTLDRPAEPPGYDPYVAKIVVELEDGRSIEWLIRRSELPPDLREMRERDLDEFFEVARRKNPMTPP